VDVLTGRAASIELERFRRDILHDGEHDSAAEIRGMTACPGVVRGRVVVVTDRSAFANVRDGDVLVSVMTRPEYLPIMQRASAFVTDEGGITCHAAIVAREMRKPCLIATKVATRVLHDGDLVDVDATNGIVRVVERAAS
jgi:pyruvate,water dikinase